jgi:hypothetical protein
MQERKNTHNYSCASWDAAAQTRKEIFPSTHELEAELVSLRFIVSFINKK